MNRQKSISAEFPYESKFIDVDGFEMHYVEAGGGGPPVLLLHGIPTHAYLWRNVIPHIAPHARTVAIDLIGFGKSAKPLDIDYDMPTYAKFLEGAVRALGLENFVLVAMDLGLIVGLNYAMRHENNMAGIVMFEGLFLPMEVTFKCFPLKSRMAMKMFYVKKFAESALVTSGTAVEKMMSMATLRELSPQEMDIYREPLSDPEVRRRVWLEGLGPTKIKAQSEQPGDVMDHINRYAEKLARSSIPKLLLTSDPGMGVTKKTIAYAQKSIDGLQVKHIGKGKHFLPEDQPENLGEAIAQFLGTLGK